MVKVKKLSQQIDISWLLASYNISLIIHEGWRSPFDVNTCTKSSPLSWLLNGRWKENYFPNCTSEATLIYHAMKNLHYKKSIHV